MPPIFFPTQLDLRTWLDQNYKSEKEIIIGFYKVGTGKQSISWSEAVDQAICFGWIDTVRKSIDAESYQIRFTTRKPNSIWSNVNIEKVDKLLKANMMLPAGMAAFEKRKLDKSGIYAFEQENIALGEPFETTFKANEKAWTFFKSQAPSYQKTAIWRIISAKQETTKLKRLHQLIADSEKGIKIKELSWKKK